jgi:hypothetical protein
MKKFFVAAWLVMFLCARAFSQYAVIDSSRLPQMFPHHIEELAYDAPSDEQAWAKVTSGLHAAFGSPDQLYFRREVPGDEISRDVKITGWKGERLNTQVIIWSPDTIKQVRLKINDLTNEKGNKITAKNISANLVRYVVANYPYGSKDATCGSSPYTNGYLMPDRFETFKRFELPGKSARPVWVSINVPSDAAAGIYKGVIEVMSEKNSEPLNVTIKVQDRTLPPPSQWSYRLDLWQNPWAVAWHNHITPWSDQHKALLKEHLKLYADAGGKYITTYAVHSPWADNSFMIEGGMIEWIKAKSGTWKFDYTIFDEYVELCMKYGINKAITIYSPLPWAERFRYMDEKTGNYVVEQWLPQSDLFKTYWTSFLDDLKKHLVKKGWMNITYIGINENAMEQTLTAIKFVKSHSPEWRITYAGDWHEELDTLLNDYSFVYGKEPTFEQQARRKARGATSTMYVCCTPPYPNNFLFSPPIEGRWLSWYASAYGYDGFLRWAYDAWPEDPARDARHGSWAAGDCFLVYPGGNSCIRYEKLREGIVDFEKIRILRQQTATKKDLWKKFDEHLKVFIKEKEFNSKKITADVEKGKAFIEQLSEK